MKDSWKKNDLLIWWTQLTKVGNWIPHENLLGLTFQKPINMEQFALMVEFMENNGSGELRCERPKMKWFIM